MRSSLKLIDEVREFVGAMERPHGVRYVGGYLCRLEHALKKADEEERRGAVWCRVEYCGAKMKIVGNVEMLPMSFEVHKKAIRLVRELGRKFRKAEAKGPAAK